MGVDVEKKAKITKEDGFECAPDGHTVVVFNFGDIVTGQVAEWALAARAASAMFDPREDTKVVAPPETKGKASRKKTKKAARDGA